ncbi:MAG: ATP-binding protein [Acidobacteriota bacterium]
MRRLFLRIFLWFWVAMAAVAALLIVSSPLLTRSRPAVERWQRDVEGALKDQLAKAAPLVERGKLERLEAPHRPPAHVPPVFLLDAEGGAVSGPKPPREVSEFGCRVAAAGEEIAERTGTSHMVGRPVAGPDGSRYVLVAALHRPPRLVDLLEPGVLGWRIALLTLLAGAVCFWLARHLTAPVSALRGAVRQLASGDLSARVGSRLARRRDEIGDLARDFDAMAARLEALLSAQRRLLRDVSHELRSPLARLGVALELARKRAGASASEQLDRIELEAGRLDALIDQLLTLSRLEVAGQPAAAEVVDLRTLAEAVADDAAFEAAGSRVTVRVEANGDPVVEGDPEALRSAIENVLRNAVRFGSSGSEVRVELACEGGEAVVRVLDRGPGVPQAHIEDLFEPFFRVEEARDRSRGGAGLGLAIASRAVRLSGGRITARNRDGGGLEVAIRLPAHLSAKG